MREWFCVIAGVRYGPVSDATLRAWVAEGRLKPSDLIWSAGMAAWMPLSTVPEFSASSPFPLIESMTGVAPSCGAGGTTPNKELMRQARERLRGQWGHAVLFTFLYGLLTVGIQIVPYLGGCAMLIIGGSFELGAVIFFLAFSRGSKLEMGTLFKGFSNFGNALGAYLLRSIFMMAWMIGAVIPGAVIGIIAGLVTHNLTVGLIVGGVLGGIPMFAALWIAGLGYALTFYLMADRPSLGALEPILESWRTMRGRKWKLFCLQLRFLGWSLLGILSCGIGFLWIGPYIAISLSRFYDDVRAAAAAPIAQAGQPATPGSPPTPAAGV